MLWFLSRTVKKLLTIFNFLFLKIYNCALFKNILSNNFLRFRSSNMFLHQMYLWIFTLLKQKKLWKFSHFFPCSVQGAQCGNRQKFHADWRIFKHCEKSTNMSDGFLSHQWERVNDLMRLSFLEHILGLQTVWVLYGKIL